MECRCSTLPCASRSEPLEPSSALPFATVASSALSATLAGISYVRRSLRLSRLTLVLQRTFTRTSEVGGLPSSLVLMSESKDITNALNSNTGLLPSIASLSSLTGFESLVITDQSAYTPSETYVPPSAPLPHSNPISHSATTLASSYHLILTLTLPPTPSPPTPSLIDRKSVV